MLWLPSVKDQAISTGETEYAEVEVKLLILCGLSQISRPSQTFHFP